MNSDLSEIYEQFPTQSDCIKHLERVIWQGIPTCPYCRSNRSTPLKNGCRYQCNSCNTPYSVTVGTVFHNTKLPLQKWFLAINIILVLRDDLSARKLSKALGVTKDTAWRISAQIRAAMQDSGKTLIKIVSVNEVQGL